MTVWPPSITHTMLTRISLFKDESEIVMSTNCDFCAYNEYDEDDEAYYCSVNMDEDDMARFMQSSYKECPYYRSGDEYKVVRHQM